MATSTRLWSRVKWWRDQGVNAKWGRFRGCPLMYVECGGKYHPLSTQAWGMIEKQLDKGETLESAVFSAYGLIDFFSLPMRSADVLVESVDRN